MTGDVFVVARISLDADKIVRLYTVDNLSCAEIGQKLGVSTGTIWGRLKESNTTLRSQGKDKYSSLAKQIVELYCERHNTMCFVANELGMSKSAVRKRLIEQPYPKG
jgi:predicted DNA-binding protein YlxM (UPF0122 family)